MKITAVIIDDEKKARETLKMLLEAAYSEVQVAGMANGIESGYKLIKKLSPQLVFLDVEMQDGTGFDLLNKFNAIPFEIIFTTAYSDYALQAIKASALDYVLKPIDTDDLAKAVDKALNLFLQEGRQDKTSRQAPAPSRLALPLTNGFIYVKSEDIIRIEANGSYSTIFLSSGEKHMVSKHLKEYEEMLDPSRFFRSHNSHIINLACVKRFIREDGFFAEMQDGTRAEISRRKKDIFIELMKG